jgi:hypothetical protein
LVDSIGLPFLSNDDDEIGNTPRKWLERMKVDAALRQLDKLTKDGTGKLGFGHSVACTTAVDTKPIRDIQNDTNRNEVTHTVNRNMRSASAGV